MRSGNTRLALPFLRPLLPLPTNSNSNINSNSRNNSSSSYHDELHGQHATTKNGTQDMSHDREPSAELPHIRSTADKSAAAEFFTSPDTSTRSKKRKDPPSRALELLDAAAAHSSCGESSDVGSLSYSLSYSNSSANSSSGALYSPSALHSAKEAWEAVIRVTAKQTPEGTSHKRNKTHHDVTEENVKPIDLLGVLDKIHRAQYRTVKEYYADLNYIRNLLKTKLASHYRDTGTEESVVVQLLSNHSVLMTFDTIIDSSYTYLSDKLLRVHELEQRIQEQMTEGLLENKEVETFPCSPDHVQAPAVNAENSEDSTVPINVSDEPQEESILKAGENIAAPALTSTTVVSDVNPVDGAEVASANSAPTVRTRRSVSAHITDTGSGPPVRSASASPQVTALMRVLWRVECTQLVPSTAVVKIATARSNSSNSNHSPRTTAAAAAGSSSSGVHAIGAHLTNSASLMHSGLSATVATATMPDFRIGERSLLAWTAYVEQGRFPTEHRGADDPFSMRGTIAANEARHAEKGVMQYKTREMLYGCGDPQFATYMVRLAIVVMCCWRS